jgi:hypothetical protein
MVGLRWNEVKGCPTHWMPLPAPPKPEQPDDDEAVALLREFVETESVIRIGSVQARARDYLAKRGEGRRG